VTGNTITLSSSDSIIGETGSTVLISNATGDPIHTGAADQKIADLEAAYTMGKEAEYRTYWEFRAQYNSMTSKVELTPAEIQAYTDRYTSEHMTSDEITAAIVTFENARTTEYNVLTGQFNQYFSDLHQTLPTSYSSSFVYVIPATKDAEIRAGTKIWT